MFLGFRSLSLLRIRHKNRHEREYTSQAVVRRSIRFQKAETSANLPGSAGHSDSPRHPDTLFVQILPRRSTRILHNRDPAAKVHEHADVLWPFFCLAIRYSCYRMSKIGISSGHCTICDQLMRSRSRYLIAIAILFFHVYAGQREHASEPLVSSPCLKLGYIENPTDHEHMLRLIFRYRKSRPLPLFTLLTSFTLSLHLQ